MTRATELRALRRPSGLSLGAISGQWSVVALHCFGQHLVFSEWVMSGLPNEGSSSFPETVMRCYEHRSQRPCPFLVPWAGGHSAPRDRHFELRHSRVEAKRRRSEGKATFQLIAEHPFIPLSLPLSGQPPSSSQSGQMLLLNVPTPPGDPIREADDEEFLSTGPQAIPSHSCDAVPDPRIPSGLPCGPGRVRRAVNTQA